MRYKKLQDWLNWQEGLNPKEIDLGLDRVSEVLNKLDFSSHFFCPTITVAGTNGKGSTVAFIEAICFHSTLTVGCYTSPHLFKYNERIRINQQAVSDEVLCEAFHIIDLARADIPLTYFEFGTLAALVIFKKYNVDIAVLEVGLGGRLDAVNVIDADVSVITSIDVDHTDWLGNDVNLIAREKAGIMRKDKPAVVAYVNPQQSLLDYAEQLQVPLVCLGKDYLFQGVGQKSWQLKASNLNLMDLPMPKLRGGFQLQNASAAIMALHLLDLNHQWLAADIKQGLLGVDLLGRFQTINESPLVIVDVAHNAQSAQMLVGLLNEQQCKGKTIGVVAMLADKPIHEVISIVQPEIDSWLSAGLNVPRGLDANKLAEAVRESVAGVKLSACKNVVQACQQAISLAGEDDRIIVFGSFYTVAEASQFFMSQINES